MAVGKRIADGVPCAGEAAERISHRGCPSAVVYECKIRLSGSGAVNGITEGDVSGNFYRCRSAHILYGVYMTVCSV